MGNQRRPDAPRSFQTLAPATFNSEFDSLMGEEPYSSYKDTAINRRNMSTLKLLARSVSAHGGNNTFIVISPSL